MKFPLLFRKEGTSAAALARQDQAEKLISESLRLLGQVFTKLADAVEAQRLSRAGYEEQEKYLERTEQKKRD